MIGTYVIGVKSGFSGALAVLTPAGDVACLADLPIARAGALTWCDGAELQSILDDALGDRPALAFVERIVPCYRFTHSVTFGSILGVLQALHFPIELVTVSVWKSAHKLAAADRAAMLHRARELFPAAELGPANASRAAALLIARFGLMRSAPEVASRSGTISTLSQHHP